MRDDFISTARVVGRKGLNRLISRRSLRDPATNLEVGTHLLAELISHFRGNVPVALAGYNAGRGAARSWLRARGHLPIDAFVEIHNDRNGEEIFNYFQDSGINIFSQSLGWQKINSLEEMPVTNKVGYVFVSSKPEMPWSADN